MRVALSRWPLAAVSALSLLGLAACSDSADMKSAPPAAVAAPATLYERLGGKPAITAVVDDFVANVAADKRVNRSFRKANIPHLKMELVDQICAGSGGPCQYTGKSMKDAHKGMGVTGAAFDAVVQDLQKSLNTLKVPAREQGELLAILGPMKSDIVQAKPAAPVKKAAKPVKKS